MNLQPLLDVAPYSLGKKEKTKIFDHLLHQLTQHHYQNCLPYKYMMNGIDFDVNSGFTASQIPYLPVRLFKTNELYSIPKEKIVKTPTPFSNNLYSDFDGECYRVNVVETECSGNEQEFNFAI